MHGLVLGKFMPPHKGHCLLVDFARNFTSDLTVVVGSLRSEPIDGELRFAWMRELFPDTNVVHLQDENPQYPDEHPDFWSIWKSSLERVAGRKIDLLFASEDYGQKLAEVLGAEFVPCTAHRSLIPVSGTMVRESPHHHWDYLPICVQAHYVKKIAFLGPESTGKTTLSQRLAKEFGATWVPEYARSFLKGREDDFGLQEMEHIARGQLASEKALARAGKPWLFCDTDPASSKLWCRELFGSVPQSVERLAQHSDYELTILLDCDVAWEKDPLRLAPDTRKRFFEWCENLLTEAGRPYEIIRGDWSQRYQCTYDLIAKRLEPRPEPF